MFYFLFHSNQIDLLSIWKQVITHLDDIEMTMIHIDDSYEEYQFGMIQLYQMTEIRAREQIKKNMDCEYVFYFSKQYDKQCVRWFDPQQINHWIYFLEQLQKIIQKMEQLKDTNLFMMNLVPDPNNVQNRFHHAFYEYHSLTENNLHLFWKKRAMNTDMIKEDFFQIIPEEWSELFQSWNLYSPFFWYWMNPSLLIEQIIKLVPHHKNIHSLFCSLEEQEQNQWKEWMQSWETTIGHCNWNHPLIHLLKHSNEDIFQSNKIVPYESCFIPIFILRGSIFQASISLDTQIQTSFITERCKIINNYMYSLWIQNYKLPFDLYALCEQLPDFCEYRPNIYSFYLDSSHLCKIARHIVWYPFQNTYLIPYYMSLQPIPGICLIYQMQELNIEFCIKYHELTNMQFAICWIWNIQPNINFREWCDDMIERWIPILQQRLYMDQRIIWYNIPETYKCLWDFWVSYAKQKHIIFGSVIWFPYSAQQYRSFPKRLPQKPKLYYWKHSTYLGQFDMGQWVRWFQTTQQHTTHIRPIMDLKPMDYTHSIWNQWQSSIHIPKIIFRAQKAQLPIIAIVSREPEYDITDFYQRGWRGTWWNYSMNEEPDSFITWVIAKAILPYQTTINLQNWEYGMEIIMNLRKKPELYPIDWIPLEILE